MRRTRWAVSLNVGSPVAANVTLLMTIIQFRVNLKYVRTGILHGEATVGTTASNTLQIEQNIWTGRCICYGDDEVFGIVQQNGSRTIIGRL